MKTDTAGLMMLSFLSAALCWLPLIIAPGLDLPVWLPLFYVGCSVGISSFLNSRRWPAFLLSSAIGAFAGLCAGSAIWSPLDPIAASWVPVVVILLTLATAVVAAVSGWIGSKIPAPGAKLRRAAWFALVGITASGLICLALTPSLMARKAARNEQFAEERFTSLQRAVERTLATSSNPDLLCAGPLLARNYTGLPFSREDWLRITGNYVQQDGYFFMVYCRENPGYVIDARPVRDRVDGARHFCASESGKVGCTMEWNRSRHVCLPCQK